MKKQNLFISGYHFFLALLFIYVGAQVIQGRLGEYPREWLTKLPFTSWVLPGFAILLLGLSHLFVAGIDLFQSRSIVARLMLLMGSFLIVSGILSIMILGETYLATVELILLGSIHLVLGGIILWKAAHSSQSIRI
ncbi:hypothetical protein [Enterococcus aquimarinus]|uniref:Uncharacterized protein n=1 Tax=Enterococcus aquimarinus TaxID=328396 RepID=A0A1L8QPS0_9ENTE|nr:hypothetical protein [Enterococcus aquimarinus]OJG09467.1 hypothetical protein RU93_GL000798 [Enterococcus aquimarinus]